MADAPIVDPTSGWFYARTNQFVRIQVFASESPTGWAASYGFPPGVSISAGGLVTGSTTEPGIYHIGLRATNAVGTSPAVRLSIRIDDREYSQGAGIDLKFDINSGAVTSTFEKKVKVKEGKTEKEYPVVMVAASGDKQVLSVALTKVDAVQTVATESLALGAKRFDTDKLALIISNGVVRAVGSGIAQRYEIVVEFDKAKLGKILREYEDENGTFFLMRSELQLAWNYPPLTISGTPELMIRTSEPFLIMIPKDIVPEPS